MKVCSTEMVEQEMKMKKLPQKATERKIEGDSGNPRHKNKLLRSQTKFCEPDGTPALKDLSECGVPKLSQLGESPKSDWNSRRSLVPILKKAPLWFLPMAIFCLYKKDHSSFVIILIIQDMPPSPHSILML